ncbi:hypothetical protein CAEBREN_29955 [Caenorhabditis brenneri]|uniref:GH18 domain-containing protein n=1 Tax=Caenorhabditis brenneri TaxID=135651 RepID=G0NAH0_CAEBE|nr:hypothetical protein CAEBREN_29955 [Caenorhabditis brenneri]
MASENNYTGWESMEINRRQLSKLTHIVFAFLRVDLDGSIHFNSDYAKQRDFIESVILFIKENRAYGVDIAWKWPDASDKWNYVIFLKELRNALNNEDENFLLSIIAPPIDVGDWEFGFEMEEILRYVDFVNINSMDYYGAWEDQWGTPTGPSSPLYYGIEQRKTFNVYWTLKYYVCKYEQLEKYNIAIPFYGSVWKNVRDPIDPNYEIWRNVEFVNGKPEGKAYMSRRTMEEEGWKTKPSSWDEQTQSSYIWNQENRTFLAFETERSIEAKTTFVTDMNLGGVWIWSLDMDDNRISLLNDVATHEFCFSGKTEASVMYKC